MTNQETTRHPDPSTLPGSATVYLGRNTQIILQKLYMYGCVHVHTSTASESDLFARQYNFFPEIFFGSCMEWSGNCGVLGKDSGIHPPLFCL